MARPPALIEHLYRRAGFGLSSTEREPFLPIPSPGRPRAGSYRELVDSLLVFDPASADVDRFIGTPGYVGITTTAAFTPNTDINHARQRWLFRMVHTPAPLQERMALIWHHHFATAYSKVADAYGGPDATRLMAAKPSEDPAGQRGQIELFRDHGLGSFRDLLVAVAMDPAMLVWLDGRTNTKARPQENFARELMELFTFGVDQFTEPDVYAAARVFTGWNLRVAGARDSGRASYTFFYNAAQHDTGAKAFSFSIPGQASTSANQIPARSAADGLQDGLDLINALAVHPVTAARLARRLWTWFVSETEAVPESFVNSIAATYLANGTRIRPVMRALFLSPEFQDARVFHRRYAWPVEFVVRLLKEVGFRGFSVADALTPLRNMGLQLFEPLDVNGWDLGPAWFTTGGMLARMNFASQLVTNQRVAIRDRARPFGASPETLVGFVYDTLSLPAPDREVLDALSGYVRSGSAWTGSDVQVLAKAAGLVHLAGASGPYQFV
jgi:uncharacterized protein (DUF1800 family)